MIPHVNDSKENADDNVSYDYQKAKEIKWHHQLLLNRPLKVVVTLLLAAIVAPLVVYQLLFYRSLDQPPTDGYSFGSCLIPRTTRLQCGIQTGNQKDCHPQCCFDSGQNVCFHRFPSRFSYITERQREWSEEVVLHPRVSSVPYGSPIVTNLRLSVDEISPSHLSLTFYNSNEMSIQGNRLEEKSYSYNISSPELNIVVNGTQGTIFNTMRGPLIASNNIWEFAFRVTEESMYGLGEIPLTENTTKILYNHEGGLSSIPLIFAKSNGSFHGLLINTIEPTEISIEGGNQIVIRSIATQGLKFHVFVGPKPEDVMRDVMKLIGYHFEVEYWMLGAHVCSDVSSNSEDAYEDLSKFLENATNDNFHFESHCGARSVVFENNCDKQDEDYVESGEKLLRNYNKRYLPHVSPFIRYEKPNDTSEENNVEQSRNEECSIVTKFEKYLFRTADTKEVYTGLVGDYDVIYPDYENASKKLIDNLWKYTATLDGVILENNWPLDETFKNHSKTYWYLPYFSKNFEEAFNHTPQWNITRPSGRKYLYNHNDYGNNFAIAFRKISNETIPIISSSQWMNGNVAINRQSINASWTNLQRELTAAALGGISGHWLWSSPICGDTEYFDPETQTNLCVKWYMAATYLPLIKIHSKSVERHPLAFIGTNRLYMITALNRRTSILPYIFTTLQEGPLLRPMFYQFPSSERLVNLTSQYSVGEDLLIVPNLQPSQSHVHVWVPPGTWYEIWSGLKLDGEEGEAVTLTTTEADFLTLIRGGSIIVMQKDVKETAELTRLHSNLSLTIALHCETLNNTTPSTTNTLECIASGKLYMTKDMSLTFKANSKKLFIGANGTGFQSFCDKDAIWASTINEINIFGLEVENNNYDSSRKVQVSIDLCQLESNIEIAYSFV